MATEFRKGIKRITTNYVRLGSTLALGVIEVPLLFHWLGTDGFGLVALLGPTVGLAAVVQEIVNTSLIRELGIVHHTRDSERFGHAYHASIRIAVFATAITAVAVVAMVLLLPFLSIDPGLLRAAQVFAIAGGAFAMARVILAPTLSMIVIREHFVLQNTLLVLYRVFFLLTAVVLYFVLGRDNVPASISWYGVFAFGSNILVLLVAAIVLWILEHDLRPSFSRARAANASEIISSFGWNTAVILAINLADRVPQIIINILFGTTGNAIYGVALRLGAYARMITVGLTYGLESVVTRLSSQEDRQQQIHRFLTASTRLHAAIALPAAVTLAVLAEPLLTVWIASAVQNPGNVIPRAVPVAQLFVVAMVTRGIGEGWVRILYGDGHVRKYAPVLITAALLLPVTVLLAAKYAPVSLSLTLPAAAFAAVWLIGYGIFVPIVGTTPLGVRLGDFYRPMIRPAVLALITLGILVLCNKLLAPYTLAGLGLTMIGTGAVLAAAAFVFVLRPGERRRVFGVARRYRPGTQASPPA